MCHQSEAAATARSAELIALGRPSILSRCKLSNYSFQHAAPYIWNSLPSTFRTPSYSSHQPSLSHEQFHKQLKNYLFDLPFHLFTMNCYLCVKFPSFNTSSLDWFPGLWLCTINGHFLLFCLSDWHW